ncbi:MAG: T9SS type A sorting domain-containing protein [Bacteroidales bacterium]|nr:T9SS type A sorting domain-containing protein [Bacteroidales bacterium]
MKKEYSPMRLLLCLLFLLFTGYEALAQSANFQADVMNTCVGQNVVFTNTSIGTTPNTIYEWTFGEGANPANAVGEGPVTVTYTTIGQKTVSLKITEGGSSNTETKNNYISVSAGNTITLTSGPGTNMQTVCLNDPLAPSITYATTGGNNVNVDGLPLGVNFVFNNNLLVISGTPAETGNFNYLIELTGGCGKATASGSIIVNPLPIPNLQSSIAGNEFCAGTEVMFTAAGGTYYNFRVNGVSQQNSTVNTFTTNSLIDGTTVDVVVTSESGCSAVSAGIVNQVHPLPTPVITGSAAICGLPATTAYSVNPQPNRSYVWTVNEGLIANGQGTNSIQVDWNNDGIGQVSVIETNTITNCARSVSKEVIKAPASVGGNLTGEKSICEGSTSGILMLNNYVGTVLGWQYSTDQIIWTDTLYTATSFISNPLYQTTFFRAVVQSGGCATVSSTIAKITVLPLPTLIINAPAPVCHPQTVDLTAAAITAGSSPDIQLSYWRNAEATQPLLNPESVTNSGIYFIKAENAVSCSVIGEVQIIVSPRPDLLITPNANPICFESPLSLLLTGQEGTIWSWINPDTTNKNPVVLYPPVGQHTYTATAKNSYGCIDTTSVTIQVLPLPEIQIAAEGGPEACANVEKTFTATLHPDFSYQWFVNNVLIADNDSPVLVQLIEGENPVKVKVNATNMITGCSMADSMTVSPVQPPVLEMDVTKEQLCIGDQTFITLSTSQPPVNPPVYFAWGDGLQGNVLTRGFIPTQDTLIWAEAINATGCITRKEVHISVQDTLSFDIVSVATNEVVCANSEVEFSGPEHPDYSYQWYVDNQPIPEATESVFTHSFTQNSTVRLVVTDTDYGCSGSDVVYVTVKHAPVFDLGDDLELCQGYEHTLYGPEGDGYSYIWLMNGMFVSDKKDFSFVVSQGVNSIKLAVSSSEGCTKDDEIKITSKPIPTIALTTSKQDICLGETVTLTANTNSAQSVLWFTGQITTGPHMQLIQPGIGDSTYLYWAQAVHSNGCTVRDTVEVTVHNPPEVELQVVGDSPDICINSEVVIQGPQNPGYTYQWKKNGQPIGGDHYELGFVVTEDAEITLKVTNAYGCSTISAPLQINVIDLPGIILEANKTDICLGENVQLSIDRQHISSFFWQDGLGGSSPSRQFTPENIGLFTFWASGIHKTTGCLSIDTAFVQVHPNPQAFINPPVSATVCEGQAVQLTTDALIDHQYVWLVEGDSIGHGAVLNFIATNTVTVVLEVTNQYGCKATDELLITVEDSPEVDLGGDRAVCLNYELELEGPENENFSYKWYVNNQLVNDQEYRYSFIVEHEVIVRLEVTVGNCTSSDQIQITPLVIPGIQLTSDKSAVCFGGSVHLQLLTQDASSYQWWDGFTGLTNRIVVPTHSDTTIAYWAEAINGLGCKNWDTVFVEVHALPDPVIEIVGGNDMICLNAPVTLHSPLIEGYSYQWFIDDVIVEGDMNSLSFTVTKDVVVGLQITDVNGCSEYGEKAVYVRDLPGIILLPDTLDVCLGASFTLVIDDQHIQSFSWFDGLAGNKKQRSFEATEEGVFIYWAEGVNSYGCVTRDTAIVQVHPNPEISIVLPIEGNTICRHETMTLAAMPADGLKYEWYVGGVLADTTAVFSFIALETVNVTLIATDKNECQAVDEVLIDVLDAIVLDLGGNIEECEGYVLSYQAPPGEGYHYAWFIDDQLMGTEPEFTLLLTKDIVLRLEVITADGCATTDEITIHALPSPSISLSPDELDICLGESAVLNLNTNGSSFIWWDGLGTNVTTRSFTPSIGDSIYAYWAEAVNILGCRSRDTAFVHVHNHPDFEIYFADNTDTFCYGATATIIGPEEEGYQYQWYIDDIPEGENTHLFSFTVTDEVIVRLEVTDQYGCFGEDSLAVFLYHDPGIILHPDSLDICLGESFTLVIDPVNILSFNWWDGLAGGQTERTFTPTVSDTTLVYWAEGINSLGCISHDTAYIIVHSLPIANIISFMGDEICQGETIQFTTDTIENHIYEWLINEVVVDTGALLTFVAENNVTIGLRVTNQYGCVSTDSVELTVYETPDLNLGKDFWACLGDSIVLQGPEGEGFFYQWFVNDIPDTTNTYQLIHMLIDTVTIRLEMNTINGCFVSDEITIVPYVSPDLELFAEPQEICLNESIVLSAVTGNAASFVWWDGVTDLVRELIPEVSGVFYAWAEVTSVDNCVLTDSIQITVHPLPEVELHIYDGQAVVCEGMSITFSVQDMAGIDITHVIWNQSVTEPMGSDSIKYFTYEFFESQYFRADMISAEGCIGTDSIFIEVQPIPEILISSDTTICSGQSVTLQASGGVSCIWTDENGTPLGVGYSLTVRPDVTTIYYATIVGSGSLECANTAYVTVSVMPSPVLTVEASEDEICAGTEIVLTATGASAYAWSTGETEPVITVEPVETTTYYVIGLNEYGCIATDSIHITVLPTPQVILEGLLPLYCLFDDPSVLVGLPKGGSLIGPGILDDEFHPEEAGPGIHIIQYIYSNQYGCSGIATQSTKVVDITDTIDLGKPVAICPHEQIIFDAGPGFEQYFWSTGDTTRTTTIKGNAYFPGTTRTITVIGMIQECAVIGSVELTVRDDCYIGVDELTENEEMILIPNPSTGIFTIRHHGESGSLTIHIFDGRGVGVFSTVFEACTDNTSACQINLSHMPKGVYMVTIRKDNKQFVRKMVIM